MKLSIIGVGKVGSTLAYTLLLQGLVEQLVLVGRRPRHAAGEAADLRHSLSFLRHPAQIEAGDLAATAGSDIVVLTASSPWEPGMIDRLAMAAQNSSLFEQMVPTLARLSPNAKLVVVSNPVDVLTYRTLELSGFPHERVMGTGTLIDSARFRSILAERLQIHPSDLRAYIFGEHGVTQFPALSLAQAAGVPIDEEVGRKAFHDAVEGGYAAFRDKGDTSYAAAQAAALVVEAIVQDSCLTMPLSVYVDGYLGVHDVCLSVPVVLGRSGIRRVLFPELNAEEADAFRASAALVRGTLATLKAEPGQK